MRRKKECKKRVSKNKYENISEEKKQRLKGCQEIYRETKKF